MVLHHALKCCRDAFIFNTDWICCLLFCKRHAECLLRDQARLCSLYWEHRPHPKIPAWIDRVSDTLRKHTIALLAVGNPMPDHLLYLHRMTEEVKSRSLKQRVFSF